MKPEQYIVETSRVVDGENILLVVIPIAEQDTYSLCAIIGETMYEDPVLANVTEASVKAGFGTYAAKPPNPKYIRENWLLIN